MIDLTPFVPSTKVGYACQTVLADRVNDFLHKGVYHCWFATELNPMGNGDSSNPSWLYLIIDRAVKQDDSSHSKIKDIRANLMRGAQKVLESRGRNHEVPPLIKQIEMADLKLLRPQLWKLKLETIDPKRYEGKYQYPNEALIQDLKESEFERIVE